ncbi:MAG TPA: hypothetical protein VK963_03600, partial [Candidatus Saccharimonadales bacterium]|nr:hypothetical protein [Candidatus Saccharimonadales bacterium]
MFQRLPQKITLAVVMTALVLVLDGGKLRAAGGRDCDSNAVVYCGALSKAELVQKMQAGDGRRSGTELQQVFYDGGWGMSEVEINSYDTVMGTVRKDGTVWAGGRMVATGAVSSGRQFMPGSYQENGLWLRPPSVSFRSTELPAFVYMPNGRFQWAIIQSCGNPVRAQAVAEQRVETRVQERPVRVVERERPVVQKVVERPVTVVERPVVREVVETRSAPLPVTGVSEALGMAAGT